MIDVHDGHLFVGPAEDATAKQGCDGWSIVSAADRFHWSTVGRLPLDHPEGLVARRENRLLLNLADAPVELVIPEVVYSRALDFISERMAAGDRVLVHCEQGVSRSASVAMLWVRRHAPEVLPPDFDAAYARFREIYPPAFFGRAVRHSVAAHWDAFAPK